MSTEPEPGGTPADLCVRDCYNRGDGLVAGWLTGQITTGRYRNSATGFANPSDEG
ncbi:hypothetical protein [uncultured Tateyamaria sp.]|uniref:hypothetical protein n=1 Tax=uncultured Tateyamaria sp. TaxID=455651 RepID=UPI00261F9EBB|nr:hypothetical protein [uncultured Tateyamaria sp.]